MRSARRFTFLLHLLSIEVIGNALAEAADPSILKLGFSQAWGRA